MPEIKLFVVDTGPLITLAAADALDYSSARAAGRDASRIEKLPHPIPAIDEEIRKLIRR